MHELMVQEHVIQLSIATLWIIALPAVVGLKSHPQYILAKRQMRGYSGMVTFYIKGGENEARKFLSSLKVIWICKYFFLIFMHVFKQSQGDLNIHTRLKYLFARIATNIIWLNLFV